MAAPHRLAVVADPNDYLWPAFSQTTESDWGTIVKAAHGISFIVGVYNGVIRLIDPLRTLNKGEAVVRLMKSTNTFDEKALLIDFTPLATSKSDRISHTPKWAYLTSAGTTRKVNEDGIHFHSDVYIPDAARARMQAEPDPQTSMPGTTGPPPGSGATPASTWARWWRWLPASRTRRWTPTTACGSWSGRRRSWSDSSYQQILMLVRDKPCLATQLRAEPFWGRQARPTLRLSGDTCVQLAECCVMAGSPRSRPDRATSRASSGSSAGVFP